METRLEQFLYGPSPGGIKVRASSVGVNPKQFEAMTMDYYPVDERFIGNAGGMDRECRIITDVPRQDAIFFTRIFRRENLDEAGRPGLLNHTLLVPKPLLRQGLTFADLDEAMTYADRQPKAPLGEIPPMTVVYGDRSAKEEMAPLRTLMSEKALGDLIDLYSKAPQMKMCITCRAAEKERRALCYGLVRMLDLEAGLLPISACSAALMGKYMESTTCNLMVINVEIMIRSGIGWARMLADAKESVAIIHVDDAAKERAKELKANLFR